MHFRKGSKLFTRVIPNYALYGVQAQPGWQSLFDFEWIPKRSRPYNWKIRPHKHDALIQILYLTQGAGEVLLDHSKVRFNAPCLVLVPAQTVHGFSFSENVDGPVVTAAQRPLEALVSVASPELLALVRKPSVMPLGDVSGQAESLMPLFLAVERETHMPAAGQLTAGMALLMAICIQMARFARVNDVIPANAGSRTPAHIEKFRSMVDAHYKEHLPISHYAGQLGISPGQLSRLCREVLGVSSMDVVNARVVHEAQRGLVYTSNSIKQLAFVLGFSDEAYFCRFFRKHTGVSPRAFRKKAMAAIVDPVSVNGVA